MLVVEENDDDVEVEHHSDDGNAAELTTKRIKFEAGDSDKKKKAPEKVLGEEYKAKNAGGDVWKKGMLEPHAYVPLDGRMLTKKNTDKAVNHFSQLMQNSRERTGRHGKNISRSQRRAKLKHSLK
jgi:ribosomal RNA-processing protein 12